MLLFLQKKKTLTPLTATLLTLASPAHAGTPSLATLAARFAEPLMATAPTTPADDTALRDAILRDQGQPADETMPALAAYASRHAQSGWQLALWTNLGLNAERHGYYTLAVEDLERAGRAAYNVTALPARRLADRALGELMRLHGRLGHQDRLAALLHDTAGRAMAGSATELRTEAAEALGFMRQHPEAAFRCGPAALRSVMAANAAPPAALAALDRVPSGPGGTSLASLARLAGGDYQVIRRDSGADVPVPAVVHWKSGHFAAIMARAHGGYDVADPVFGGGRIWLSQAAIDAESSGYMLTKQPARRAGWHLAAADEAKTIMGGGYVGQSFLQTALTLLDRLAQGDCGCNHGMTGYAFMEMAVSLQLSDTPVGYVPPKGPPVRVTITYNQRDQANQPSSFAFSNVSPLWTMNWLSFIQDDPANPGNRVSRYAAGGGAVDYTGYVTEGGNFSPDPYDASVLSYAGGNQPSYQRSLPDGSIEIYAASNGALTAPRLIFLSKLIDPAGNAVTLNYDSQMRLTSLTDATGRQTVFGYTNSNPLLITSITDPFGRAATLSYDSQGRLVQITDVLGIMSTYQYDSNSLVNYLKTPYGVTNFTYGETNGDERFVQATDPLGNTEEVEFREGAPGINDDEPAVPAGLANPVNNYLSDRDTFYWDKHAYAVGAGNYLKARMRHWTHVQINGQLQSTLSNFLESERPALESRIWYSYPGQGANLPGYLNGTLNKPVDIARLLDNGSTQLTQLQYNAQGNPTSITDPAGRTTTLGYAANGMDVISVQQTIGSGPVTVGSYTYNMQHLPLTYTDAAGQTTQYAYNAAGQLVSVTNALNQTTRFNYSTLGYLTSVVNANGKTAASFTYDNFGRIATRTDSEGWTVAYAYDAMDRVTQETYPDGTTRVYGYTNLDLVSVKDRRGRTTMLSYDAVRRLTQVSDPLNDVTQFGYYENQVPKTLTDPNLNVTSWGVDVESRVTGKTYADGSTVASSYEASTSRLHAVTDALGQTKTYSYAADDKLTGITYSNAVNPTPSVGFTYDPYFPRVVAMVDGSGTTNYGYAPVGSLGALHLASEAPPFANSAITYQYDALGRVVARAVGGDMETLAYDALGRVIGHDNDLGHFSLAYLGQTGQLTERQAGIVGTRWVYGNNLADRRLHAVINSPVASRFRLTTVPEDDILGLDEDAGYQSWGYSYDLADRLSAATSSLAGAYKYGFDPASNLGVIKTPSGTTSAGSNNLNQITSFGGTAFTYNANGNLLSDYARTYQWDAENRLVGIGYLGKASTATALRYDGLGRRIAITDTVGAVATQTHFGWCGETLCQARSAADVPTKRYLTEGEAGTAQGTALYYGVDHLGSVHDALLAGSGLRVGHFDYDPYGNLTSSVGLTTGRTDFRYARLYYHMLSGLYLAPHRSLDPVTGRWTSRDPSLGFGRSDPYDYVEGRPTTRLDGSGLDSILFWAGTSQELQSYGQYQQVINSPEYKAAEAQRQADVALEALKFDLEVAVGLIPGGGEAELCLSGAGALDALSYGGSKVFGKAAAQIAGEQAGQAAEAVSSPILSTIMKQFFPPPAQSENQTPWIH